MTKGMFALLLAGALMVPHVTPALGTDSTLGIRAPPGSASKRRGIAASTHPLSRYVALVGYGRTRPKSRYLDGS
jgi:hypothetical protein